MLDRSFARITPESLLFAGGHQPARRDLGISSLTVEDSIVPVQAVDLIKTPFCTVVELARADLESQSNVLLVAPLSGHFPVLLRDLIIGLLPSCRVYVTDWMNIRHVPAKHGSFGLDANIAYVLDTIKALPAGLNVIALCQSGVPALAATALLASDHDPRTPASLVLMGSPIDPLANPTGVATLLRSRPLSWFEASLIKSVARKYAGGGRSVYPAHLHLMSLSIYLTRRMSQGGELRAKVFFDDGADIRRFPFFDLFTSVMDLDARFLLENTRAVFQELLVSGRRVPLPGRPRGPRRDRQDFASHHRGRTGRYRRSRPDKRCARLMPFACRSLPSSYRSPRLGPFLPLSWEYVPAPCHPRHPAVSERRRTALTTAFN